MWTHTGVFFALEKGKSDGILRKKTAKKVVHDYRENDKIDSISKVYGIIILKEVNAYEEKVKSL